MTVENGAWSARFLFSGQLNREREDQIHTPGKDGAACCALRERGQGFTTCVRLFLRELVRPGRRGRRWDGAGEKVAVAALETATACAELKWPAGGWIAENWRRRDE